MGGGGGLLFFRGGLVGVCSLRCYLPTLGKVPTFS